MSGDFETFMQDCRTRVDRSLEQALQLTDARSPRLTEAMRYSLTNGGKRVRPVLAYASALAISGEMPAERSSIDTDGSSSHADGSSIKAEGSSIKAEGSLTGADGSLTGADGAAIDNVACALEAIHAYSLVHDDLPAMDDDDLRRGQPTCHIAYDEATAILAGDALQALAFELLAIAPGLAPELTVQLLRELARAAGAAGMVAGQAIDLAAVDTQLNLAELENMHAHKTGALIRASVIMGALTAGASKTQLAALTRYAEAVGLAFQVQDDILDVTADTETLGKRQGADEALNKPTYVSLLGLEAAKTKALELHRTALVALAEFGGSADQLRALSAYTVQRNH